MICKECQIDKTLSEFKKKIGSKKIYYSKVCLLCLRKARISNGVNIREYNRRFDKIRDLYKSEEIIIKDLKRKGWVDLSDIYTIISIYLEVYPDPKMSNTLEEIGFMWNKLIELINKK